MTPRRSLPAAALALLAVAAPARADVSGPDIVGFLNAQRAAQGIPAGIVEDPALSSACFKHDQYGAATGTLTHDEDDANPNRTPEGDAAAHQSVIYAGAGPWTATRNPFETAPIHLHQLLAPRLDRMGAAETQGYGCATTLASRNRPAPAADVTYTYPGNGATGWATAQTAAEGPYTPGERVGIPAGTRTGPYLYVMFDGPDVRTFDTAHATGATLTGPSGPVDVAVVDNATDGLSGYLPTGMELIPRAPLAEGATYTASVTADVTTQSGTRPFASSWTFTTTGIRDNALRIAGVSASGRAVAVTVASSAPGAVVDAAGPGAATSAPVGTDGVARLALPADGTWQVCARSGGGATGYTMASDCTSVTVAAPIVLPPIVDPFPLKPAGVAYTARAALQGRAVRVVVQCRAACRIRASATVRRGGLRVTLPTRRATKAKAGTATLTLRIGAEQAARLAHRHGRRVITVKVAVTGARTTTLTLRR